VVLETPWNDCVLVELSGDLPVVSDRFIFDIGVAAATAVAVIELL